MTYDKKMRCKYLGKLKTLVKPENEYFVLVTHESIHTNRDIAFVYDDESIRNCIACFEYKPEEWLELDN